MLCYQAMMDNHGNHIIVASLCVAMLLQMILPTVDGVIAYQFPRYSYKKKPKVERLFKTEWRKCDATDECGHLFGVEKTRCVRICLAPICHQELYAHDELEEGEIDVRSTSFKGCWRQRYHEFRINRVDL